MSFWRHSIGPTEEVERYLAAAGWIRTAITIGGTHGQLGASLCETIVVWIPPEYQEQHTHSGGYSWEQAVAIQMIRDMAETA